MTAVARHLSEGIDVMTGTTIDCASASSITLADGTHLEYDIVIAGDGAVPNTELAEAAGLDVDNGIVVDSVFRTSNPNVFATGYCCNFEWRGSRVRLESRKAAQDQGSHVAKSLLGATDAYTIVPWFWSDQFELTLNVAGLFDLSKHIHQRQTTDDKCIVFQCNEHGELAAAAGIGPGNAVTKDLRILSDRSSVEPWWIPLH